MELATSHSRTDVDLGHKMLFDRQLERQIRTVRWRCGTSGLPWPPVAERLRSSLAALALVLGGSTCSPTREDPPPTHAPNILLVTLDTVRVDHLGCYGYERATSPNLDQLASVADRYTDALSTAPWTVPSHASIFTGKYAFQHGAEASEKAPDWATQNALPLSSEFTTLADVLKSDGYRTAGFVANSVFLAPRFGFAKGFDTYVAERKPAAQVNSGVVDFLAKRDAKPFFLFVNYMDAHRPYDTTPLADAATRRLPPPDPEEPQVLLDRYIEAVMGEAKEDVAALRARVVTQYDTGVANDDRALGALIAKLKELALYDDTLIIVTADHGEYLGEHQLVEHNKDVYQEALRVPLIVKRVGQTRGRVVSTPLSHAELASLIGSRLDAATSKSLLAKFPYPPGAAIRLAEIYFSRPNELRASWGARFKRVRAALFLEKWKYIRSSDGQDELYDLAADPREAKNLIGEKRELAKQLRAKLENFMSDAKKPDSGATPVEVSPKEADELRRLGYLDDRKK